MLLNPSFNPLAVFCCCCWHRMINFNPVLVYLLLTPALQKPTAVLISLRLQPDTSHILDVSSTQSFLASAQLVSFFSCPVPLQLNPALGIFIAPGLKLFSLLISSRSLAVSPHSRFSTSVTRLFSSSSRLLSQCCGNGSHLRRHSMTHTMPVYVWRRRKEE